MVANTTNATSLFIPQSIIESQIASCLSANKKNYHPWLSFSTSFYLLGSDQSRVSFIISVNLSAVILNSFNFNIYITFLEPTRRRLTFNQQCMVPIEQSYYVKDHYCNAHYQIASRKQTNLCFWINVLLCVWCQEKKTPNMRNISKKGLVPRFALLNIEINDLI